MRRPLTRKQVQNNFFPIRMVCDRLASADAVPISFPVCGKKLFPFLEDAGESSRSLGPMENERIRFCTRQMKIGGRLLGSNMRFCLNYKLTRQEARETDRQRREGAFSR